MKNTRSGWSPTTKLTVSLLILGLFIYMVSRFRVVISPFILACVLAYIISPIVNFFDQRVHIPRGLVSSITYLLIITIMFTVPAVLIPRLASQIALLTVDIQLFLLEIVDLFGHQYVIGGQVIDGAAILQQLIGFVQELLRPIFGGTLGFAFGIIESVIWIIFILVVSFYLVKDSASLRKWAEKLPPAGYVNDFIRLREMINNIWAAFFRGQLLLATVVATIFTAFGLIVGLPAPLAMGVFAGLLEFFPSVGHGIWITTASIIALFAGSTWMQVPNWVFALMILGLHIVYQQFDLNYLIPRIIGRQVHLPPLVVILGIVAGAAIGGVLGIALAAPTIASARVIGRYIFANLFDTDPFPALATSPLPPPNPRWWAIHRDRDREDNQPDPIEKE